MKKNKSLSQFPPLVFNVFKPARMNSYDVVRHFKRHLPSGFGKIGHFGTLDPFASGVLMIGIGGAARLNDYIHEFLPKTYLAIGKIGIETPTGDYTSEISQRDDSQYLLQNISRFSSEFIEEILRVKFLGEYWQAPHKFSASKFLGKNLHEWAREGVEIKKEPVRRYIHSIQVVKYQFPYLSLRVTVSSGTFVRTLFTDVSNELGTIGSLIALVRENVGAVSYKDGIRKGQWPQNREIDFIKKGIRVDEILPFANAKLSEDQVAYFKNGAFLKPGDLNLGVGKINSKLLWMKDNSNKLLGLGQKESEIEIRPKINFHSEDLEVPSSDHNLE